MPPVLPGTPETTELSCAADDVLRELDVLTSPDTRELATKAAPGERPRVGGAAEARRFRLEAMGAGDGAVSREEVGMLVATLLEQEDALNRMRLTEGGLVRRASMG